MHSSRPVCGRGLLLVVAVVFAVALLPACGDDGPGGLYPAGAIRVTTSPEFLPADWQLVGPDGFEFDGRGHELLESVVPGRYTITWSDVPLQSTPPPETRQVAAGETVSFHGDYRLVGPDHGDELMDWFRQAHDERSFQVYRLLVDEDFRFIPQGGAEPWGRDTELDIMLKIFSEAAGDGGVVVADVAIERIEALGTWNQTPPDDPEFGAFTDDSMYRDYDLEMRVAMAGLGLVYRIEGPTRFYVIPREENGLERWRLLGLIDHTLGGKTTELMSWTQLRLMFD